MKIAVEGGSLESIGTWTDSATRSVHTEWKGTSLHEPKSITGSRAYCEFFIWLINERVESTAQRYAHATIQVVSAEEAASSSS